MNVSAVLLSPQCPSESVSMPVAIFPPDNIDCSLEIA